MYAVGLFIQLWKELEDHYKIIHFSEFAIYIVGICLSKINILTFLDQEWQKVTPTAMWKSGGQHAITHENCDCKSGLFHQIVISEHGGDLYF